MAGFSDRYKRILVAVDFSSHSDAALRQGLWLAQQCGAEITLAHTITDLRESAYRTSYLARVELLDGKSEGFQREVRLDKEQKLRQLVADNLAAGAPIQIKVFTGTPIVELIQAVQQGQYDLVLAGTRGLSPWQRFLIGSTAKRLIRKCPSSVWVVKAEHQGPPQKVIATTDFSEVSRRAVIEGLWIATQASAEFHLLHVIDKLEVPRDILAILPEVDSVVKDIDADAQRQLEKFVKSLDVDTSQVRQHLRWGTPWEEIGQFARELNADVIAMGTVGRSGIKGLLLGSAAERTLETCDCSILVVKPEGFESPIVATDR